MTGVRREPLPAKTGRGSRQLWFLPRSISGREEAGEVPGDEEVRVVMRIRSLVSWLPPAVALAISQAIRFWYHNVGAEPKRL